MNDDFQLINHCLFKGILIFFGLPRELDRERFEKCVRVMQNKAKMELSETAVAAYWEGVKERMNGTARWDRFAPMVDQKKDFVAWDRSFNDIDRISQKRPYTTFRLAVSGCDPQKPHRAGRAQLNQRLT